MNTQSNQLERELRIAICRYVQFLRRIGIEESDIEIDRTALNRLLHCIEQGDLKAAQVAYRSMDTAVRDHVPGRIVDTMFPTND